MTVHLLTDGLPDDLPREVVSTLTGAVREAVTNVAKHAGTNEAWVTATTTAGITRITVVDRGPIATTYGNYGDRYNTRIVSYTYFANYRGWAMPAGQ